MRNDNYLLGIDLGTSACKAVVFSPIKGILGKWTEEIKLITKSHNIVEQDANEWWDKTKKAIKRAIVNSGISSKRIRALAVTSQGISFVPVDRNVKPLCNAISWLDTRPEDQTKEILKEYKREQIFRITGKRIHPAYVLPKLLWLKENKPALFEKTEKFLMAMDFLLAKLTGRFVTDHTLGAGTLFYDINKLSWSEEILKKFAVPKEKLPELKWAGEVVGRVSSKASQETGLSGETLVVTGAQDQKCSAFGAGLKKGIITISLGTAGAITALAQKPVIDKEMRIPCFPYVRRDNWVLEAVISAVGASVNWFCNTFGVRISDLEKTASESRPGANGLFFLPHLSGATSPHWKEDARGTFCYLNLSSRKRDLARAVLEGIAFEIKTNLNVVKSLGVRINEISVFGGGTNNRLWLNVISNVLGREVSVPEFSQNTTAVGACMLAGQGCGMSSESKTAGKKSVIRPDKKFVFAYKRLFEKYSKINETLIRNMA